MIPYQSWIENSLDKKGLRNTVALIQNGPHRLSKQCLSSKKGNHHCIFCSCYYYTAHTYFLFQLNSRRINSTTYSLVTCIYRQTQIYYRFLSMPKKYSCSDKKADHLAAFAALICDSYFRYGVPGIVGYQWPVMYHYKCCKFEHIYNSLGQPISCEV